jgi:hypothetical protein
MKRLILALALSAAALSGCAQLGQPNADAGATAERQASPFPKSSSNIAGN